MLKKIITYIEAALKIIYFLILVVVLFLLIFFFESYKQLFNILISELLK